MKDSIDRNNVFKFWFPIEKSQETIDPTTGEEIMRLGGIASTSDEDSDGEFLDPKGFDIKPLMERGTVNWHHQAKGQPSAIIGEPTKAEIRPEGLYIETDLYPSSKIAREVWELAGTLEKDSKTRRLGYSIEGRVVKRKSENPQSPDYKRIVKAVITGVAITHMPKNPKTFANIIKGEIDDPETEGEEEIREEEKALSAEGNGAPLKRESVDDGSRPKILTKSEVMERIFRDIPGISITKAEQIQKLISKIANMKPKKKKVITDEDIAKAYETLGLQMDSSDVEKGEECGCENGGKEKTISKSKTTKAQDTEEEETSSEEEETDTEEEEGDTEKGCVKKGGQGGNRLDRIEKAIATSLEHNTMFFKAVGVMIKDASLKLEAAAEREEKMMEIIKAQDETISALSEQIEAIGSEVPAPKSISAARPVERVFGKGEEVDIEKGGDEKRVSMSRQPAVVAELLDQATFAKGYDPEFSKAVTSFEASHTLPASIIERVQKEFGYKIVK